MGAAAIWLDPARATLGYGQVDILLAAAVLYDLTLPGTSRWKGAAIGLAAGIKLTPAIFVAYLLLTRRYRAAATAAAVFAATVAAGFAVIPASSAWYWAGEFANPGHVSPVQDPENQSLLGVLSRTLHTVNVLPLWLPLAAAVAVTGLALAAAAGRRGDDAARLQPVRGYRAARLADLVDSPLGHRHPGTASGRDGGRPRLASREGGGGPPRRGRDRGGRGHRMDPAGAGHSCLGLARHARGRRGVQRGLRPHRRARPSAGRRVPAARHPQGARPAVRSS